MSIERKLNLLGLNDKESLVYKSALQLDSFTVSEISTQSGVKRSTCYIVLGELVKKGLVSFVPGSKKIKYKAESPDIFEKQARQQLSFVERFLPDLKSLNSSNAKSPTIRFYTGQKGIQNILEETIKAKEKKVYHIGASTAIVQTVGDEFMKSYISRRDNAGIKVSTIRIREHEVEEGVYTDQSKLRDIRFAPRNINIHNNIVIMKDKVAIISTPESGFGFIIESKEMADTMLALFEILWDISSEE